MQSVRDVVCQAIENFNSYQDGESQVQNDSNAVLYGQGGALDSLGLVNLIVEVEDGINSSFGTSIVLADEKAFSSRRSPFRTVDNLIDYIEILVGVKADVG